MGSYITKQILFSFYIATCGLIKNRATSIRCNTRSIKLSGKTVSNQARRLRIMAKLGYLETQNFGDHVEYTMTPKGLALYDSIAIYLEQL